MIRRVREIVQSFIIYHATPLWKRHSNHGWHTSPAGVGLFSKELLRNGDIFEIEIERVEKNAKHKIHDLYSEGGGLKIQRLKAQSMIGKKTKKFVNPSGGA